MYLPWTLGLLLPATTTAWAVGNLLGAIAAYKRKTAFDNAMLSVFLTLSSPPYYWLAMLLLFFFAVRVKMFPLGGAYLNGVIPSLTPGFILAMLHEHSNHWFNETIDIYGRS